MKEDIHAKTFGFASTLGSCLLDFPRHRSTSWDCAFVIIAVVVVAFEEELYINVVVVKKKRASSTARDLWVANKHQRMLCIAKV